MIDSKKARKAFDGCEKRYGIFNTDNDTGYQSIRQSG